MASPKSPNRYIMEDGSCVPSKRLLIKGEEQEAQDMAAEGLFSNSSKPAATIQPCCCCLWLSLRTVMDGRWHLSGPSFTSTAPAHGHLSSVGVCAA